MNNHKTRRFLAVLSGAIMAAAFFTGCSKQEAPPSLAPSVAPVQSQGIDEADMEHMLPVLEGIALALESGIEYDAKNPEAVWEILYYVAYNNGAKGAEAVAGEDGTLAVSEDLMERYAAACFEGMEELPKVAGNMVTFDEKTEIYTLKASDKGEAYGKIHAAETVTKGLYRAAVNLFAGDDELPYDQYEFTLVDSKDDDGGQPSFAYSVRSAAILKMDPGSMAR